MSGTAAPSRRYTADELLAAARKAGHPVTRRLITDWVSIGLLDKATATGRGRGKGKTYTWPEEQRMLFLTVLDHHRSAPRPVLCNIPVALWLIWGDHYAPLRQARRAVKTWAGQYGAVSWTNARKAAKEVLGQLEHPATSRKDRRELEDTIAQAAYTGTVDHDRLTEATRKVFDPNRTGLTRGPLGIMDADAYIHTIIARTEALRQLDTIPDETFRDARADYLTIGPTAEHANARLDIAGRPVSTRLLGATTTPDFQEILQRACLDLITLLGLNLTEPRPPRPERPSWTPPKGGRLKNT